ncbi:MAG: GGDEF domain-containing protein [Coprobacillus sp.]
MNKLYSLLKDSIKNENIIFTSHQKEIGRLNALILRFIILISLGIFLLLCLFNIIVSYSITQLTYIYIFPIIMLILLAAIFMKKRSHYLVLMGLYLSFTIFYLVTLYLSAIVFPDSLGASILGLLLLIPLVIIDKTWRINTVTIIFYIIFIVSSFIYKDVNVALDDMINCGVFTVIGMILGQYLKKIKLTNITNQDKFKKLSHTDALTHLYNRRRLDDFMCSSDIDKQITGVIMIDIDFFKQFNDTYGHQQGDKCLEEVGACLYRVAKINHLKPFRYGGEEFVITSLSHSYEELYTIANDIKESILEMQLDFKESPYKYITISAGVSELQNCKAIDAYDLVDKADKALYHAKSNGRNMVVGYSYLKR